MILFNEKLNNSTKTWFVPGGIEQHSEEILKAETEVFEHLSRLDTFIGSGNSDLKLPIYLLIIASKSLKRDTQ